MVIIGGGSGAFSAAITAVEIGAKVLLAESKLIGGTCVNRGCIPTKFLIDIAKDIKILREKANLNSFNIKKIVEKKNILVANLRKQKYEDLVEYYGFDYIPYKAEFSGNEKIKVGNEEITFKKCIIATGSSVAIPPIPNLHKVKYLTSDEILDIEKLPKKLVVIGGSAVGLEIGQAFSRFGSKVYIVELMPRILPQEDPEISEHLRKYLEEEGIEIFTSSNVREIEEKNGIKIVKIIQNETKKELLIECDEILVATGRTPNTQGIGLEKVGVKVNEKGFIETDEFTRTSNPNIYAVGDCTGKMMLVTVAAYEGKIAAKNALLGNKKKVDYSSIPYAVFTDPEVAGIGLSYENLIKKGKNPKVAKIDFSYIPRAIVSEKTKGFIKICIENDFIISARAIGHIASEIIQKLTIPIKYKIPTEDIIDTIDVYPTFSEAVKLCLQTLEKDVAKLSCCAG